MNSIRVYPNLLTQSESDEIAKSKPIAGVDSSIGGYDEYSINANSILPKIQSAVNSYLDALQITNLYHYRCSRIAHIGGPIERHHDIEVKLMPKHRVSNFVVVTYLTDFEMGEIIFPQHGFIHKPSKGDTIIFPTGPFFQHLVNPAIGPRIIMRTEYILNVKVFEPNINQDLWL